MTVMLCRNRVADFAKWKSVFDANWPAAEQAGLSLRGLWRVVDDPNNVFFLFDVADVERAKAFINDPKAAESGRESGVLDGEYHFLQ